jgi:predicted GNAT family acetyltransferase
MAIREAQAKVTNDPAASRYDMTLDGKPVGFLDYRSLPDRMVLTYIEIDPRFGGRGLGGELTAAVLDDCRARGLRVVATCPFIADYIGAHPEYADLSGPD